MTRLLPASVETAVLICVLAMGPSIARAQSDPAAACFGKAAGTPEERISACTTVIAEEIGGPECVIIAHAQRAAAYNRQGDFDRAIADYSHFLWYQPENVAAYASRGHDYLELKDFAKAIADFDDVLRRDPKDAQSYGERGYAYYQTRKYDRAIADYDLAILLNPNNAHFYEVRGAAFVNKGETEHAFQDCDRAIALNPKLSGAYACRASAHVRKSEHALAIDDFTQAITLNPQVASFYLGRGQAYRGAGFPDKALSDFDSAIELSNTPESYRYRANLYYATGDIDHEVADRKRVVEGDPKSSEAYSQLAGAQWRRGDVDATLANIEQAIRFDQNAAGFYRFKGIVLLTSNRPRDALESLRRANEIKHRPYYDELWLDLASRRSAQPSDLVERAKRLDLSKWPAPLIKLLLGDMSFQDLIVAADDPDPRKRAGQMCEVNFYAGELALANDKLDDAISRIRLAADDCPKTFFEWMPAVAELRLLDARSKDRELKAAK